MLRRAGRGWRRGALGACTEGLGSDSGDVGGAEIDQLPAGAGEEAPGGGGVEPPPPEEEEEKGRARGGVPLLPPAMPRAAGGLAMRAERRGGRLILTEVRADERERRGLFRAERDGGRLLLRFADDSDDGSGAETGAAGISSAAAAAAGGELCQVAAAGAACRARVEVGAAIEI